MSALDPRLVSLRDPTWAGMPGPEVPAIDPPLAELIFRATARFTRGLHGFKTPFVLADLLVVAMRRVAALQRRRNYQLAVCAWSPLVIVDFVGSPPAATATRLPSRFLSPRCQLYGGGPGSRQR